VRRFVCSLFLLLLVACASSPKRGEKTRAIDAKDSAPPTSIDVDRLPAVVPRFEPNSRYGNTTPYRVLGEEYNVLQKRRDYVERGVASWYGTKFHGKLTSNREPYDMFSFSAAHKSLPLPTYARVTNLENGRVLVVRINDRGPFVANRIIDLSYAAAVKLGVNVRGTALVEVAAIDMTDPDSARATVAPTSIGNHDAPKLYLQVGAFDQLANAKLLRDNLRGRGFSPVRLVRVRQGLRILHRVWLGPIANVEALDQLSSQIQTAGFGSAKTIIR
jgi:rare lipoprotein A